VTKTDDTSALRRVPQQPRSRARVQRVLDTADRLLETEGAAALTPARLAQEAGISVGSLYQWFPDVDAVLRSLVERYTSQFEELARAFAAAALDEPPADPVGAALSLFADAFRARPAFRALWFGGLRTEQLRDVARGSLRPIGDALVSVLARQYPQAAPQLVASVTEMFVLVGDALLRQAFRRDARGDQALLDEAALMLRTYVEARLTAPS
jgi:AcrR family transcriptional regulator